jgi:hypothetical protein
MVILSHESFELCMWLLGKRGNKKQTLTCWRVIISIIAFQCGEKKKKQSVPGEQNKNWKVIMYYFPSKERGSYEVRMIIKKELKKKITRH